MDNLQTSLKNASAQIIPALNDRQRLKALLSDCLSGNKLQLNLLLNAYDNDIPLKLQNSTTVSDKYLFLQGLVQSLIGDYGISEQAALWTIETWCIILEVTLLSDTIASNIPSSTSISVSNVPNDDIPKSVLDTLLEEDDYIDFSISCKDKYYVIRSPSNEKNAGISLDSLEVLPCHRYSSLGGKTIEAYTLTFRVPRTVAKSRLQVYTYLYSDKGSFMQKNSNEPGFDYYSWNIVCSFWPGKQFTTPFFIRLLFLDSVGQSPASTTKTKRNKRIEKNTSITSSYNNLLLFSSAITGVSLSVLNNLLEEDDYIDFSLSLKGICYVIRSPSNEKKAGISLDGLEIVPSLSWACDAYKLKFTIPRKFAEKKLTIFSYLYTDKGSFVDKEYGRPDFDHYAWDFTCLYWPEDKFTVPFFIRLLFDVN